MEIPEGIVENKPTWSKKAKMKKVIFYFKSSDGAKWAENRFVTHLLEVHQNEDSKVTYLSHVEIKKKENNSKCLRVDWLNALIILGSCFLLQCNILYVPGSRHSCKDGVLGLLLSVYHTNCRNLSFLENVSPCFPPAWSVLLIIWPVKVNKGLFRCITFKGFAPCCSLRVVSVKAYVRKTNCSA